MKNIYFLDLFAGGGGLSEGFLRAGFKAIAHVEMDEAASYTLATRQAYHWLVANKNIDIYDQYLEGKISRQEFYKNIPPDIINSIINLEITEQSFPTIIKEINSKLEGREISLIVGGPPCQAYSLVGRSRDKNKMIGDKRNYLYIMYAKFLDEYKPKYFVFENVTGLLSAKDDNNELYFDKMKNLFKEIGYSIEYKILNSFDYGVLQNRYRVVIIGKRGNRKNFYPNINATTHNYKVDEIFKDLPKLSAGQGQINPVATLKYSGDYLYDSKIKSKEYENITFHISRPNNENDLKIYRLAVKSLEKYNRQLNYLDIPKEMQTHKNTKSFLDRFKVVANNLPYSHTVVAHISKDGHYYIHPDIKQNRSLTPREAARLQTFPDNYFFESVSGIPSRTAAYKQIGNAVPVLMAEKIAIEIMEMIK